MQKKSVLLLILIVLNGGCTTTTAIAQKPFPTLPPDTLEKIAELQIDSATSQKIDAVIKLEMDDDQGRTGETLAQVANEFMGTPYVDHMLQGSETLPERLVIDFRGLDCFTYLDYVTALSKSRSRQEFIVNLVRTRYTEGDISFRHRRHFFTDWAYHSDPLAKDVTAQISPATRTVEKNLNQKANGSFYLPGLPVVARSLTYIPSENIDAVVISKLRTGDYIGIYTGLAGLDVTHVGLFVRTDTGPMIRNASSKKANMKVVDSPFLDYVKKIPGIIVLRPL